MSTLSLSQSVEQVRDGAYALTGSNHDYDPLMDLVGNARYVLLGEASHGTHEFCQARAEISKRLILEKGFTVLAWEADWPDALRVNRYVRATGRDTSAVEALGDFKRFPIWMWRNVEILEVGRWLRS